MVDEEFTLIAAHLDEIMKVKIGNGDYIDFAWLIPMDRMLLEDDKRMEFVVKNGQTFILPVSDREATSISNFSRWEQAFRVYSTIYVGFYPQKAKELIQYNHIIYSASSTYVWENVYAYDRDFRMHLSRHPGHNWGIILHQAWVLRMKDRVGNKTSWSSGNGSTSVSCSNFASTKSGNKSLNHHTLRDICSVHYNDIDYAVKTSFKWKGKNGVYNAKTDLKSAFRILGLNISSFRWLVMRAQHPCTGQWYYFIDKCLPFGASISCSHFQRFSNALKHIFEYQVGKTMVVTNYRDDFLFVSPTRAGCNALVRKFVLLCKHLGVPVAEEKTEWVSHNQKMIFLGLLLDGRNFVITIPEQKRVKALNWLRMINANRKAKVKDLEKLTGLLNFLNRALFAGRAFTRHMYAKYSKITGDKKLKSYHHVTLDKEFKEDCRVWAANPDMDFGCFFKGSWIFGQWEDDFVQWHEPSIEFLELYTLVVGIFTWIHRLEVYDQIIVFCDNESVVAMINSTSSNCKFCMTLIRQLVLLGLKHHLRIFAKHLRGKDNKFSDSLSRLKIQYFKQLAHEERINIDPIPTRPSKLLWPLSIFWKNYCASLLN